MDFTIMTNNKLEIEQFLNCSDCGLKLHKIRMLHIAHWRDVHRRSHMRYLPGEEGCSS